MGAHSSSSTREKTASLLNDDEWDKNKAVRFLKSAVYHKEQAIPKTVKAFIEEFISNSPSFYLAVSVGAMGHNIATLCGLALSASIGREWYKSYQEYSTILRIYKDYRDGKKRAHSPELDNKQKNEAMDAVIAKLKEDLHRHQAMLLGIPHINIKEIFKTSHFDRKAEELEQKRINKNDITKASNNINSLSKAKNKLKNINFSLSSYNKHANNISKAVGKHIGYAIGSALSSIFTNATTGSNYKAIFKDGLVSIIQLPVSALQIRYAFMKAAPPPQKLPLSSIFGRSKNPIKLPVEKIMGQNKDEKQHSEIVELQQTAQITTRKTNHSLVQYALETGFFVFHIYEIFHQAAANNYPTVILGAITSMAAIGAYAHFGKNIKKHRGDKTEALKTLLDIYKKNNTPTPPTNT